MLEAISFGDAGWGDEMLMGAFWTVAVSISSILLGLVIGIILAGFKLSSIRVLNLTAEFYTTVIRGVPELLVIYLLFFGGGSAVMYVAKIFGYFGYIELQPFVIGTLAVGAISGAYSTEVIRGAVNAIPRSQFETGSALGLKGFRLYQKIIKRAMIKIDRFLDQSSLQAKMLLQVHDELIFEVLDSEVEQASKEISLIMEKACEPVLKLSVPLIVESGFGDSWALAH